MLLLKVVLCRTFLGLFRITYTAVVVEVVLVFSVNGFIKQVVFSMMILQELVRVGLEKSRAVIDDRDINDSKFWSIDTIVRPTLTRLSETEIRAFINTDIAKTVTG